MTKRVWLLLPIAALVLACSHQDGPFEQISGHWFDHTKVKKIVDGQTLDRDVRAWFGEPSAVKPLDGVKREFVYVSIRRRENIQTILFVRRRHFQTWQQRLSLTLDGAVVERHEYLATTLEQ